MKPWMEMRMLLWILQRAVYSKCWVTLSCCILIPIGGRSNFRELLHLSSKEWFLTINQLFNHLMNFHMLADEVPISAAFAFQKDSEYVHLFNHFLKKMIEAGIVFKINKDISKRKIIDYEMEPAVTLGFENLAFPFLLLLGGLTLAVFMSCSERLRGHGGKLKIFRRLKEEGRRLLLWSKFLSINILSDPIQS